MSRIWSGFRENPDNNLLLGTFSTIQAVKDSARRAGLRSSPIEFLDNNINVQTPTPDSGCLIQLGPNRSVAAGAAGQIRTLILAHLGQWEIWLDEKIGSDRKPAKTTAVKDPDDGGIGHTPMKMESTKRFRIALSFPGEKRSFVAQVAEALAVQFGRDRVLYDQWYEHEFAIVDLDTHLQRIYHDESDLIAVFLCTDYERKEWCGLEWRAIRDLIKRRQTKDVIPLRFDNTEIPGLFSTDGYVWIGDRSPRRSRT